MPPFGSSRLLALAQGLPHTVNGHRLTATALRPCPHIPLSVPVWLQRNVSTRGVPPPPPPPPPPLRQLRPHPRRSQQQPNYDGDNIKRHVDRDGNLLAGRYKRRIGPMVWASCLFGFSLALYASYYYTSYAQAVKVAQHLDLEQNADVSDRWRDRTRDFDEEVDMSEKFLLLKAKRRRLVQQAGGKVLEVSCGTGRNMELYDLRPYDELERHNPAYGRSNNTRISSITFNDQSEVMIEHAEAKFDSVQAAQPEKMRFPTDRVHFIAGDAGIKGIIPRPPGGFDTIVQTMGVCSMADAPGFLRRLGELCRQPGEQSSDSNDDGNNDDDRRGGKILLLEHGRSYYSWLNGILDNGAKMHANHYGCWWNKDVDEIVRQSGLVVDRVRRYNFGTTYEYVLRPAPRQQQ